MILGYYLADPEIRRRSCDVFLAAGTSLQVWPAAGLADIAVGSGARLVVVNAEPTPYDDVSDLVVREPIGSSLPRVVARV